MPKPVPYASMTKFIAQQFIGAIGPAFDEDDLARILGPAMTWSSHRQARTLA
jgi:hypothetical protein